MAVVNSGGFLHRARGTFARWRSARRRTSPPGPAPRIAVHVPVEINGYEKHLTGSSQNIAMGGMLLHAEGRLSVGEPVQVEFNLPDGPRIAIPAVVWRNQHPLFAIRFDVTDRQRELIQQWVEAHLRQAS